MKLMEWMKMRWLLWAWRRIPDCREMSRLASLSFEQRPSLGLRLRMGLHCLICVWCQRYQRHLHLLHRAAPHLPGQPDPPSSQTLSDEARHRMVQRLRKDLERDSNERSS